MLRLIACAALSFISVVSQAAGEEASVKEPTALPSVVVTGQKDSSKAQTTVTVDREQFKNAPAFSIAEVLALSPGVTFVQGNGPRDVSVSVRGSNNRQTFGVRNIKVYEDGFPVTQPDGLARTDLTDPHAYGSIDVVQGPSSAYYGNYATGGAINFNTQAGRDIQGVEGGVDAGSYGYLNVYAMAGGFGDHHEYSAFLSNVRGRSHTEHTNFVTTTENILATYQPTTTDRWTFKFINNDLDTDLSIRLSLDQFRTNPYQKGCADLAGAGCGSVSVFTNGFNGAKQNLSPEMAGLSRNDRRTIAGARWEHDFDAKTVWRTQFVFDNRDIKQPTGATAAIGTFPSFNLMSDVIYTDSLLGLASVSTLGLFYNFEDINSNTYNLMPGGGGKQGALTQATVGKHTNAGLRLREELVFAPEWTGVFGLGAEYTALNAVSTVYSYPVAGTPTTTAINGKLDFINFAPEFAALYTPTKDWKLHARVAAGYGTPQATNLFVTSAGVAGNNTDLKTQRNVGVDLGTDWQYEKYLTASVTGFYEFFRDEMVSQSAGAGLQSYTFNAPRSEHRGVLLSLDVHPMPALLSGAHFTTAYMYDDQIYTEYTERLSTGAQSATFDRNRNKIPGIQPQYLNARLIYDQPTGELQGLGAYLELNYRDEFYLDNGNLLKAPSYTLANFNLHYNAPADRGFLSRVTLFFAVQNLFDKTYVGSAGNIANTIDATGQQNPASVVSASTGSIYAGSPRLFYSGLRVKF
jgi:iron complex outermembrane receptor protein